MALVKHAQAQQDKQIRRLRAKRDEIDREIARLMMNPIAEYSSNRLMPGFKTTRRIKDKT